MNRRKMLKSSMLITGGICICHNSLGFDNPKSTCCYTPEIEPESITQNNNSIIIDLSKALSIAQKGDAAFVDSHDGDLKIIVVSGKNCQIDGNYMIWLAMYGSLCIYVTALLDYGVEHGPGAMKLVAGQDQPMIILFMVPLALE